MASVARDANIAPVPPPTTPEAERGAEVDRPDRFSPRPRALLTNAVSIPSGKWGALGPAPIGPSFLAEGGAFGVNSGGLNSGRITGLAVIPFGKHQGRVVAATAGGGIWTSDDEGEEWTPRTDSAEDLAIGSVTIDPSKPELQIAGTGEANQCGGCYPGVGVMVSTDYGATWSLDNPGGVFSGLDIGSVAIDPHNVAHWFAAAVDPAKEGRGGLYVTEDGGKTWEKPKDSSYAPLDGNINSVVINPTKPVTVYIGGGPALVGESTDGGVTWKAASEGITAPKTGGQRPPTIALAIAKSEPKHLYVSIGSEIEKAALYKTTTGGTSWTQITNVPDYTGQAYSYGCGVAEQGWYANAVAVDPFNDLRVFVGGIAMLETEDGGNSWANVNEGLGNTSGKFFPEGLACEPSIPNAPSLIHPDQHAIAFSGTDNAWIGDDGGVFLRKLNPDEGVKDANGNLNVTQFYKGFNEVSREVLAGSQDNASASVFSGLAPSPVAWTGIWKGDGGSSWITPNEPEKRFIEGTGLLGVTNDAFASIRAETPSGGGLFTPPILVLPNKTTPTEPTVFFGAASLWRTTEPSVKEPTWHPVTGTFFKTVSALAASKDGKVIYAGFTDGTIEVSTDEGNTFEPIASEPFTEQFVTGLSVNPSNPKEIVASFSFSDTRFRPGFPHVAVYSWSTEPGTGTWSVITGNLPSFAVSQVKYFDGTLIAAATDRGVYATGEPAGASTEWTRLGTGMPNVQVQGLDAEPEGLYAVTYGRGAWELPSPIKFPIEVCGPACVLPILVQGYPPDESVRVLFDGVTIASGRTSVEGKLNIRVQVPAGALPGSHAIEVLNDRGQGAGASLLVRTDWLSARFDAGQSGFVPDENVLSVASVGSLTQRAAPQWGGFVHSAPIYAAGEVYAAADDGSVRAFNPASGRQLWSFAGEGAIDGSPAAVPAEPSSPLNKGCAVIVGSTSGLVRGLDPANGTQLWSFNAGATVDSSPVVFGQSPPSGGKLTYRVAVTSAGSIDVLDACSGAPLWELPTAALEAPQTPAVLPDVRLPDGSSHTLIVVSFGEGTVEALDAETGGELWSRTEPGPLSAPSAFSAEGVGTGVALASGSAVQELNASTGALLWSTDIHAPIDGGVAVQAGPGPQPAGTVFAVNQAGEAFALDPLSGGVLWSTPASRTGATTHSAPTLANGVLYFVSAPRTGAPGTLQAIAASDGHPLFAGDIGDANTRPMSAGPAIADGRALVGDFTGGIRIYSP